jgi:hypothetical protein
MGKKAKEHRKKVAKRNLEIEQKKNKFKKDMQQYILSQQIKKEKEAGLYDNVKPMEEQ